MVRKRLTTDRMLLLVALACLIYTGCLTQEAEIPQTPPVASRATYPLNDLEFEHNLLRVNTRQELADHLEVLIEAHPDLVFGYQRMALGEDKAVARIANYRLAQVHLELGCALHSFRESLTPTQNQQLGVPGFPHIKRAFQIILRFEPATNDAEFAPLLEPWYDVIRRRAYSVRSESSDDFCATVWIASGGPPHPPRPSSHSHEGGSSIDPWLDAENVCTHLESQYLGPLAPFVY